MKIDIQGECRPDFPSVSGFSDFHATAGAGGTIAAGRARGRFLLATDAIILGASLALGSLAGGWAGPAADPRPLLTAALILAVLAAAGLYRRDLSDVQEVRGLVLAVAVVALADAGLRLVPGLPPAPAWHLAVWPLFAGAVLVARTLIRGGAPIRALRPATRPAGRGDAVRRRGLRAGLAAKRFFDILAAGGLILLLSPFFLIVIALIRLDGGPALFGQTRIGRGGKRFRCLKFRSMCVDAQARLAAILASDPEARAEWETHQKLRRDPRVTRIGRFLRETSLDELPQLLNVLRGEMSLVGPRPIMAPEVPGYPGDHAYYHGPSFPLYAACTPGITGLWQVSGRTDTTHEERIRLDGWYARNWSFWLDIVILLRTVRVILNRSGC